MATAGPAVLSSDAMPEGDTIHRTAAALRTAVLGKPLTAFEAPRLDGLRPSLGAVIERVESKGKHLEIGFDDGVVLHTHMRMTGSWHLYRAGEQWRKSTRQARVIIEVPGWQAVCFSAPVVRTYRAKEFLPNPRLAKLGPDLCQPDADLDGVRRPHRPAAASRDDHRGRGAARPAHRLRRGQRLQVRGAVARASCTRSPRSAPCSPEQRDALLATAGRLLRANLDRPQPGHGARACPVGSAVYGRHQKPCFRCGTPIEVAKHGEQARVTYWCPGCQLFLPLAPSPDDAAAELDRRSTRRRGSARTTRWPRRRRPGRRRCRRSTSRPADWRGRDGPTTCAEPTSGIVAPARPPTRRFGRPRRAAPERRCSTLSSRRDDDQ